jgi:fructose-1,6-bisphosphatase I
MDKIQKNLYQSCKQISEYIQSGNSHHHGAISGTNSSADDVKYLDLWTNELLKNNLSKCSSIRYISSEEDTNIIETPHTSAPYLVAFDPLDGSSNIDVNITIGTIFAVYKLDADGKLVNGRQIVMAGYCIYSQLMQMVIAEKNKPVYLYYNETDRHIITMPKSGDIYSINESNKYRWKDSRFNILVQQFISENKTLRWVGCLVADGHRTLLKGGFFAYPEDTKNESGRIRLLYEAYPMAYIIEKAGGFSSDGYLDSLLDVPFDETNVHQKTGIMLMGSEEHKLYKNMLK